MKILMVIDSLQYGGKERQLHELLKYMRQQSNLAFSILSRRRNPGDRMFAELGYSIYYPSRPSKREFFFYLNKVIREVKPDIIHSWEGFVTSSSLFWSIGRKIKVVNFDVQYACHVRILSWLYFQEKTNQILASRNVANSFAGLRAFHLRESKKNRVVHNGFDMNRIIDAPPARIREKLNIGQGFIIAMTASFTRPKDYGTLIEVGKKMLAERNNLFFLLIGDGPERPAMERRVPREWRDHFVFLGLRSDVESIIKEIDLGVLLSKKGHAEGISNSIMEYMAAARPVIATRTGGNPELVIDKVTGFLIPHQDEEELIKKIKLCMDHPMIRQEMGARGRERIGQEFSLDKLGRAFVEIYQGLDEKKNRLPV